MGTLPVYEDSGIGYIIFMLVCVLFSSLHVNIQLLNIEVVWFDNFLFWGAAFFTPVFPWEMFVVGALQSHVSS
jgi:hypothetical protein